jgi:hypothetical protein
MDMISSTIKRYLRPITLVAAIAITAGCNEETTTTTTANAPANPVPPVTAAPMSSYSGPGSNWDFDLFDDGTYTITHSGVAGEMSFSGGYQLTAAGFLTLTVDDAAGNNAPDISSTLWGVQVGGSAFFLSPVAGYGEHFIPMVSGAECTGSDLANSWINVRARSSADAASAEGSYFGSYSYRASDNGTSLESQHALTSGNPDQGAFDLGNGFCDDGVITTASSDIYLSADGSATAHVDAADPDGGFIAFAMPKTTLGSVSELDGSYSGILSDSGADVSDDVRPVVVTCNGGICAGEFVDDVATGTLSGETFTVDLSGSLNVPTIGLSTGTVTVDGRSGSLGCMLDSNMDFAGQRMIACAGQSTNRGYALLNVILSSTD